MNSCYAEAFYPLIPLPLLPRCGGEGEKNIYLYLLGGFAAQKIQNNLIPRPWGRGVDVSSAERLGVGETLCA